MGMSPVFAEMSCDHFLNGFRFCSLLFGYFFPVVFVFFFFDAFLAFTLVRQRLQLAVKRQRSPSRGEHHCFQKPRGPRLRVQRIVIPMDFLHWLHLLKRWFPKLGRLAKRQI